MHVMGIRMRIRQLIHLFKPPLLRCLFGLLMLGVLLRIALLIPPIQSPDEYLHLYRAQMLSMGQWLLKSAPDQPEVSLFAKGSQVGGWVDPALLTYKDLHWPLVLDPHRELSPEEKAAVARLRWTQYETFVTLPGAGYYFPLIYAPQATGLALGRWLNLSVDTSYWLCRVLTTLTCMTVLVFSLRILSPPPLAWALLCLPMTVFQFLSPTIDGLSSAISVLILSLFIKSCDHGQQPHQLFSWGLGLIILAVVASRTHLLAFLLIPFFLAWRHTSPRDFGVGIVVAITAMAWIAFAIWTTQDGRIANRSGTGSQLLHYLTNPFDFLQILWATLTDSHTFLHYQRSFVGILGWLNVLLPVNAYPVLWSGLGFCGLLSIHWLYNDRGACSSCRLFLVLMGGVSAILVFVAMLTTWTPAEASIIEGVQGRYFTVPALMVAYALTVSQEKRHDVWSWVTHLVVFSFTILSFSALILALLARYD
jgi:uncharacterized membrane protein